MPYGNPLCWEQWNCIIPHLLDKPLNAIQEPFQSYFGVWFFVIVWAVFIFVIWLRSQNPMYVSVIGIFIAFTITGLNGKAVGIGIMLIGVSIGITLYQLYQNRINYPVT